jgi:hypothetical protein
MFECGDRMIRLGQFCVGLILWLGVVATDEARAGAPPCSAGQEYQAADFSVPVTDLHTTSGGEVLDTLRQFGVRTIIRYYDKPAETLACKTLLPNESDAILAKGFSIAVVFQHHSEDPEIFFDKSRGEEDAERALALAAANGQPYGSAIYFSVDGADQVIDDLVFEYKRSGGKPMTGSRRSKYSDRQRHIDNYSRFLKYKNDVFGTSIDNLSAKSILPFVRRYFVDVDRVFRKAAAADPGKGTYEIGAYGSGLVCDFLLGNKLVTYCWLAQSTGWPNYSEFKDSGKWSLLQSNPTSCPSWTYRRDASKTPDFDFNKVPAGRPDFGQWSAKRDDAVAIDRPTTCAEP